jgi:hypothetical protein
MEPSSQATATEQAVARPRTPAIVAGWRREQSANGIVLTVQLAFTRQQADERRWEKLPLVLNDRQLRSLTRDLTRAAQERGIRLFAPAPWWRWLTARLTGRSARVSGR